MGDSPASGIYAPDQNENALIALRMRQMRGSLEPMVLIPAVNQTHQDTLAAAFVPTSSKPMHVHRLDLDVVQYTTDGLSWRPIGEGPVALVSRNAVLTMPSGDFNPVTFDTEIIDTDGAWSPGVPTRLTAPKSGIYEFFGSGGFTLPAGRVGGRVTKVGAPLKGGGLTVAGMAEATGRAGSWVRLEASEWIDFRLYQESGGPLNTATADYSAPVFGFQWVRS